MSGLNPKRLYCYSKEWEVIWWVMGGTERLYVASLDLYFRKPGISVENGFHHRAVSQNRAPLLPAPPHLPVALKSPAPCPFPHQGPQTKLTVRATLRPYEKYNYLSARHRSRLAWDRACECLVCKSFPNDSGQLASEQNMGTNADCYLRHNTDVLLTSAVCFGY